MEGINMKEIHDFLLLDGRTLKFKFGYTGGDSGYYSNFTDASKANNGEGVKYGAFFNLPDDADPYWVFDDKFVNLQADRELTEEEKSMFKFKTMVYLMKLQHGEDAAVELALKVYKRIMSENKELNN